MRAIIVEKGCGGFLNPPTHPEHTHRVETYERGRCDGTLSLSSAAACEWLPRTVRELAREILTSWEAPPIDSPEVQAWIRRVLGYFAGCYRNPTAGEREWHASELLIRHARNPMDRVDEHAGVRHIRCWYPDYQPIAADFENARWGD